MFFSQRVRDVVAITGFIVAGLVAAGLFVYVVRNPQTVLTVWAPLAAAVFIIYLLYRLVVAVEELAETT